MLVCFTVYAMAALKCLSLLSELTGSHPDEDKAHPSEVELSISQSSRSCLELSGSCKCAILLALLLSLWIVFSLLSPGHLALSLQIVKVPHIFKNNLINYRNMSAEIKKLTLIPKTHYNARCETYPRNPDIKRFPVPDDKVSWKVEYQAYKPVHYTAASVLAKPVWADNEDIRDVKVSPGFNEKDAKIDRTSFHGDYKVEDGYPLNPVGRTGVIGRGLLGRWGPNHAADPIVTRWKKKNDTIEEHPVSKKRILQFIAIKRADSGEWALPGGMVDPGETVNMTLAREFQEEALDILESGPQNANNLQEKVAELFSENGKEGMRSPGEDISLTLKREFGEETMNSIEAEPHIKEKIARQVSELFKHGCKIYCGYVDDPRNTDNAWMETVACNFHDESGDNVGRFELHAGDDAVGVKWTDIDSSLKLYASHSDFIRKTAELLGAHW